MSMSMAVWCSMTNFSIFWSAAGSKVSWDMIFVTLASWRYSRTEVKSLTAPITIESPYSQSLGKYLPVSCSSVLYQPIPMKTSPRASVTSEAQQTWCSSSVNSRKNAKNRTRDFMLLLLTSQKLLICEQDRSMAYPEMTWLYPQFSTHSYPAAWEPDSMVTCLSSFPSPTAWSMVVSWLWLSSSSSSAWCSSKQQMIWMMKIGCMYGAVWMAASSICSISKPTPKPSIHWSWIFSLWTTLPSSSTQSKLYSASTL